jgi:hypothetical protein
MASYSSPNRRSAIVSRRTGNGSDEFIFLLRELRRDFECLRKAVEKYEPMLDEVLETRTRITNLRWGMYLVLGGTVVTGGLSFIGFLGYLVWQWAMRQIF